MSDKQTQALKLALEAMGWTDEWRPEGLKEQAITAIREALAEQEELQRLRALVRAQQITIEKLEAQQQELVAYMGTDIEGNPNKFRLNPFDGGIPLYKKPQSVKVWDAEGYDALCQQLEGWKAKASKPWVGLTDEEIEDIHCTPPRARPRGKFPFARMIESKSREKNTQPSNPLTDDTRRLDALAENFWDLRCFDMPTGAGDGDIGWRVIEHHMAKPHERTVAEVYQDDPRQAIDAAIEAAHGIKEQP